MKLLTRKETNGITLREMKEYINSVSEFKFGQRNRKALYGIYCMLKRRKQKLEKEERKK